MPKDPWAEADRPVLTALNDTPQTAGDLQVDLPREFVRAVLHQNVRAGFVLAHRNASRTTYTITEAGKSHLADTVGVA